MERILLVFFAMLGAGLILAGIWAFVSYNSSFEAFEDRVTGWVQGLTGG